MKKLTFLINIFFLILGVTCSDAAHFDRKAVVVTSGSSASVTLNTTFEGISNKILFEDGFNGSISIPVDSIYEKTFTFNEYTGGNITSDMEEGDYFDPIELGAEHTVTYKIYVVGFDIFYNSNKVTDSEVEKLFKDKGNGWIQLTSNLAPYGINFTEFNWYYQGESLGTGIAKRPGFYPGKNVFSLKVSNSEYGKCISVLNGSSYSGTSEAKHYVVLDNPIDYSIPSVGNYNFEIIYANSLVKETYKKYVNGIEKISVTNKEFLADKPEFALKMEFVDRVEELIGGTNRNNLNYSWSVFTGDGSISGSKYTNTGGLFSSNGTYIKMSVTSDGFTLNPVILHINPYKPVVNFNSSVDTDRDKTLRITNVRDLRWENVPESEYNPSDMKNYVNKGMLLDADSTSALGIINKNPKFGYGVFLKLNTINEQVNGGNIVDGASYNEPVSIEVQMELSPEPKNMLDHGVALESKFKTINIIRSDPKNGLTTGFMQDVKDTGNETEWSYMYYLPGKKDPDVGNEVKVYVKDILIKYKEGGTVKYSDWFNEKIHIYTYDCLVDILDDIEYFLVY